jgi:hypothetical protein
MKGKLLFWAVCLTGVLALAAGIGALAQGSIPTQFSGVIHDYAPVAGSSGATAWEIRGPWSLRLDEEGGTASFSAAVTMELSVVGQSPTNVEGAVLAQHTHNITMKNATVTYKPTNCPSASATTPPYTAQFEIKGTASVFANGSVAPFGQYSELQVCIAGGTVEPNVPFSNVTLVFQKPAAGHFGAQPIHGVVRKANWRDD